MNRTSASFSGCLACGHRADRRSGPIATVGGLVAVLLLISANAIFVAVEFALVAVDRTKVDRAADAGGRSARMVQGLLRRLSHHLSGAQLGITITSLVLGFVAEPTLARVLEPALEPVVGASGVHGAAVGLALAVATVAQMVLGELIPKSIAIARPLRTGIVLAPAYRVYSVMFGPVISLLDGAAAWTVRRFGIEPKEELSSVRSLPELAMLFQASADEGLLDRKAGALLRRSIRFGEKTAADALIPRTSMTAVARDATAAELVALSRRTGLSRFPVFGVDLDDVVGVVHVKAVHEIDPADRGAVAIETLMTPPVVVPESRELEALLVDIQRSRNHLIVVVDEYGGTAGIVTLEDLLEEIVGEIADEYDPPEDGLTVSEQPGEWVLAGSLHPDEVFDACGLELPEGAYETLAGFVLDQLGRVPDTAGDTFELAGWTFTVEEMEKLRVAAVRIARRGPGPGSSVAGAGSAAP